MKSALYIRSKPAMLQLNDNTVVLAMKGLTVNEGLRSGLNMTVHAMLGCPIH